MFPRVSTLLRPLGQLHGLALETDPLPVVGDEGEVGEDQGEGQVGHQGVDLTVTNLLLKKIKASEPIQTPCHILQFQVFELHVDIVFEHPLHHILILATAVDGCTSRQ